MADLPGRTLGPYQIVERIGEGAMAVVYKGYQAPLGRYVAIKVLRGELTRDTAFITRFRREALAVAKLDHPNILHVYDAGVIDGVYYIAMGYTGGGSLRNQVDRGPLEVDLAVSIAAQLADALDHAHEQGIIHRDVKPNMRPLLADFGIARLLHEASRLTRTGVSIGTPEYMAPEHALMQPIDGRTDIYALGVVLYEMLCGEVPLTAATPVVTLYRHVNELPQPLRQRSGEVPAWLGGGGRQGPGQAPAGPLPAVSPSGRGPAAAAGAQPCRGRHDHAPRVAPPHRADHDRGSTQRPKRLGRRPVPLILGAIGLLLVALVLGGVFLVGVGGGDVEPSPSAVPTAPALAPGGALATATVTPTPTASPTVSPTPSPSSSPTRTPTGTPTPTATLTPSPLPTASPEPTQTPASQPEPTQEGTQIEPHITRKPTPTKSHGTQPAVTAGPRPSSTSDTSGTTP